tara:strand:+ start:3128 stop:3526 length:399 start_codon:yes stop_codon:yes gene_type:complete
MKYSEIKLPSNKKFGYFFTLLFIILAGYFFVNKSLNYAFILGAISVLFFFITSIKAELLLPLSKLWMQFGLLIGRVVSPIVLGIVFFVLFTPTAILMRLCKRDELRLKFKKQTSHWIVQDDSVQAHSFKHQF